MKMEEKKIEYQHYLICGKCREKFSITSPESNNTKLNLPKMFCPSCGAKKVQLDPSLFSGKPSMNSQSKMNIEASSEAMKMAGQMRRADEEAGVGKVVPVTSYQKGKGYGKTEMIPLETIKKIDEKIKPLLEE